MKNNDVKTYWRKTLFMVLWLASIAIAQAQVVLEKEIKITDLGLHFDGSKVTSGASNTGDNAPYDYFFGRNISAHGDCIKTYGDYVFMTWYRGGKEDRHVMLTRYNTKTGTMATIEFPHRHTGYQNKYWIGESHNTIAVGVSPLDGTIHLLYDMHSYSPARPSDGSLANDYFRYSYSVKNAALLPDADFTLDKFVQNGTGGYKHLSMPGSAANSEFLSLTYPRFFQNEGGDLFMLMREGGNNNGMYKFIKYDYNTGNWGDFTDFNRLNAKSQPGIDFNWGLYGDMKYVNGKLRIGFQRRSQDNNDKYLYQNGVYYAYSDDQTGATGWKNYKGEDFSVPLWDADEIKVMEPGDYVTTTQANKVYIVGGFDWTVTANEDVHIISQVRDLENNVTKNLHTYKPSGATDFITSEDFAGGAALYTSGNSIFLIGLTSSKRIFIEQAEGGTNNFTRVYEATTGRTFDHGVVHIENGKVYYYLMENKTGNAQPLYLQIIDLDIVPKDPTSPNNFTVQSVGETCTGMNNGKLVINAEANHDYVATINGVNYGFTQNKTIDNLSPGTYNLCIDVVGKSFEQCFEVNIQAAESLTGKISISKQSAVVSVQSGNAPYVVIKNGEEVLQTYQSDFSIDVSHGDDIQVKTTKDCQGVLSKTINLFEDLKAYPNPTNGAFELFMPNDMDYVDLEVYNIQSQVIISKRFKVNSGKLKLNLEDKPSGLYFVKVNIKKPVFIKVIKN
ncbi:BNR-4 repeat-containing protein [Tamlana fucoidanivorans]|uniref:T9SS type A sorting domain-containing protein n=1 Tax=Allotamlana fucoidanivorans TaxID=2583814 RepID=A0A5C4SM46_9FLAO|nr:BNR-4 repeat-containing protein [Tamlana fucoidanivorans]TNJ44975.1 T9SS type A sorting domain-containing protein [Tamlana fucoidanivorans]